MLGYSLRPVTPGDRPALLAIYASTRVEELARVPWSDEQRAAFVAMQFEAQDRHYREHYPRATFDLVLCDAAVAGRLYVHRGSSEIRIVDVALLPDFRGRGLGSTLLGELIAEAAASRRALTIHVEQWNRARRLYERLGFRVAEDKGVYLFMRWEPPGAGAPEGSASTTT